MIENLDEYIAEWAAEHGSERLKANLEHGIKCRGIFRDEWLKVERPGWIWDDMTRAGCWKEAMNLTEHEIDLFLEAKKIEHHSSIEFFAAYDDEDSDISCKYPTSIIFGQKAVYIYRCEACESTKDRNHKTDCKKQAGFDRLREQLHEAAEKAGLKNESYKTDRQSWITSYSGGTVGIEVFGHRWQAKAIKAGGSPGWANNGGVYFSMMDDSESVIGSVDLRGSISGEARKLWSQSLVKVSR